MYITEYYVAEEYRVYHAEVGGMHDWMTGYILIDITIERFEDNYFCDVENRIYMVSTASLYIYISELAIFLYTNSPHERTRG